MQKCKNECWHQQHQDASIHSLHLLLQRHLLVLSRYYYGNMSIGSQILRSPGLFGCPVDLIYRCFGVLMMDIQTDLPYRDWKYLLVLSRYYYGNMSVSSRILRSPGLFGCVLSNPAHDTTGHRSETWLNLICYCISLYFICHLELHQKVPENIKC